MSNGAEPFASHDDLSARPRFDPALRGYDKRQVDRYVEQVDAEVSALTAARDRAYAQVRDLTAQVQRAQAEAVELRDRPTAVDRASFRDLGPMVDQILDLAEKQAGQITDVATRRAEDVQGQAEKLLAAAQEQAARERRELDEELSARRAEQERVDEERRAAAQAELTAVRELAEKLRVEGQAAHDRAQQEAKRITEQSAQRRAAAQAELTAVRELAEKLRVEGQAAHDRAQQ
ncbi:hypothetical protein DRA43_14085, partial [Micromonospora provocatoris]